MLRKPGENPSLLQRNLRRKTSEGDLHSTSSEELKKKNSITDFTKHIYTNPYYRKEQGVTSSSLELPEPLKQLMNKFSLDQPCRFLRQDDSTLPQTAIEQDEREYTTIERENSLEKTEQKSILERAKPKLPREAIEALDVIDKCVKKGEHINYTDSLKRLLRILSPETIKEYEDQGIEFALNHDISHPIVQKNETSNKWELNLPTKYDYEIKGMILHCIDETLRIEETKYAKAIAQSSDSQAKIPDKASLIRRRVDIAARAFQANMKLGERYGWSIEGYELAKKYYKDYEDSIREQFKNGSIGKDTSREDLWKKANEYATRKLFDSIVPPEGVPRVFFPLYPGGYFEEFNTEERFKKVRPEKPYYRYLVAEPIEFGSPNFAKSIEEMSGKKVENTVLNAVIMPDKQILVLPCTFREGQRSQHSIVAKGNPCAWAGEVTIDIEEKKVTQINDKSGHFKTFDYNEEVQKKISDFALQAFKEKGYTVPLKVELTRKRPIA
jgi:hypothetical protein